MKKWVIAAVALTAMSSASFAAGDAAKGEAVFKKCMACHQNADATNKVGPMLKGVVGRAAASVADYNYSDGMKEYAATGAKWDEAALDAYLKDPKAVVAKTKMAFAGVKDDADRADLIAFLAAHP